MRQRDARIRSLLYLSPGNLPSRWAHTGQIAQMSLAFSRQVHDFELVTAGELLRRPASIAEWYGLRASLAVRHLPVALRLEREAGDAQGEQVDRAERSFVATSGGLVDLSPRYRRFATAWARLRSPDVVYTRTRAFVGPLLRLGLRVCLERHAPADADERLVHAFRDPNFLGLVVTSDRIDLGAPRDKVFVAPNALSLDWLEAPLDRDQARRQVGLPVDRAIVGYAGHLEDHKGIPVLLEAASRMPEVTFMLVGGWPDDVARLKAQAARRPNVVLTGHRARAALAPYLWSADVLVLPTSGRWAEAGVTNPLKLFDYVAARRPIVASDLPNIRAELRHDTEAVLVPPDDVDALVAGLRRVLEAPAEGKAMSERALARLRTRTWDARAGGILEFLRLQLSRH